jgi:hypothetical protein
MLPSMCVKNNREKIKNGILKGNPLKKIAFIENLLFRWNDFFSLKNLMKFSKKL